ncbi:hypothetical protein GCM10010495_77190 [Kitasatospora herbaricolor]|uniref:hypothetical protein n=1 Tax=Kitasatospora herbaricolor TaxID=68217 RepID=UPI00174E64E5|nr:hypothetical protein [Kitasatospora herbaricolor]MDQ0305836.1 uncharacterized protein YhhL (DUF1145 family) [Kitasatospora herbaricolor]GGV47978.1 hypothetical protein GCM10010495_77190 [Kitasatospora herbaricolor]
MNRRPPAPDRFRHWYGAHPLHLLLMAACFALATYAAVQLLSGQTLKVALWFIGGALLHDLVLVPLYSGADLTTQAALPPRTTTSGHLGRNGAVNHVRVPAFLALLLLLVWFPLILDLSEPYPGATALSENIYLGRWLLITATLFGASALLLAARLLSGRRGARQHRPRTAPESEPEPPAGAGSEPDVLPTPATGAPPVPGDANALPARPSPSPDTASARPQAPHPPAPVRRRTGPAIAAAALVAAGTAALLVRRARRQRHLHHGATQGGRQ